MKTWHLVLYLATNNVDNNDKCSAFSFVISELTVLTCAYGNIIKRSWKELFHIRFVLRLIFLHRPTSPLGGAPSHVGTIGLDTDFAVKLPIKEEVNEFQQPRRAEICSLTFHVFTRGRSCEGQPVGQHAFCGESPVWVLSYAEAPVVRDIHTREIET
jgi:hypothetical protein